MDSAGCGFVIVELLMKKKRLHSANRWRMKSCSTVHKRRKLKITLPKRDANHVPQIKRLEVPLGVASHLQEVVRVGAVFLAPARRLSVH